jgi:hypothetical protein
MNTGQVQIRVSVSQQLGDLLKSKADRLGVPLTQLVKYLIIKEVEDEEYPVFQASEETEIAAAKALEELPELKSITNIHQYLKQL